MPTTVDLVADYLCDPTGSADCSSKFKDLTDDFTGYGSLLTVTCGDPGSTFQLSNPSARSGQQPFSLCWGVPQMLFLGDDTTFTEGSASGYLAFKPGTDGSEFRYGNTTMARCETCLRGASSVFLKTTAEASRFTANTYIKLSGIDLQGYGFPSNPHYFEYLYITNVNAGTGEITFSTPLINTYLDTWPSYDDGSFTDVDRGGPPMLENMFHEWDQECEYRNITFDLDDGGTGPGCAMRKITFTNCVNNGPFGWFPGDNILHTWTGCSLPNARVEVDKSITDFVVDSCTINTLWFQSSSCDRLTLRNNSNLTFKMEGTPKEVIATDSTIEDLLLGSNGYGGTSRVTCTDCTINGLHFDSTTEKGIVPGLDEGLVAAGFTMADGIITCPNVPRWAFPGAWMFWHAQYENEGGFQVTAVTQPGGIGNPVLVHTTWPGGFPSFSSDELIDGRLWMRSHPCPDLTFVNCGYPDQIRKPVRGIPVSATYPASVGTTAAYNLPLFMGEVTSIVYNVTHAYAGSGALTFLLSENFFPFRLPDYSMLNYHPTIDMKVPGVRTVSRDGSVTGGGGSDANLSFSGPIWGQMANTPGVFSANVSGTDPDVSITVTFNIDQGISFQDRVTPVRLRLH